MPRSFLSAAWRNLLMANYAIDPAILQPFVPCHTELDSFEGTYYVSLVGFLFEDTRVRGIGFPFHRTFEEVNLRFYVRYRDGDNWKRGVVFMKEIVPRRMITFVANTIYGEKYATHRMRHEWKTTAEGLHVSYEWKVGRDWNYLRAVAGIQPQTIAAGSPEEFITEHYWGYTSVDADCTGVYKVRHPKWRVHPVSSFDIRCSTQELYGAAFTETLAQPPRSVFLAEGSAIEVMPGARMRR